MNSQDEYEYEYESQFRKAIAKAPKEHKYQILAMKYLLVKRLELESEYKRKYQEIRAKYDKKFQANFNKRNRLITGEEIPKASDPIFKNFPINIKNPPDEKGIPFYWSKCLLNSSQLKHKINHKDIKILQNLKSIKCENKQNGDYTIIFSFYEKEIKTYFTNNELSIEFICDKSINVKEIKSTKINWSNDIVNSTIEMVRVRDKKTKEIKTVKRPIASFFNMFITMRLNNNSNNNNEQFEDTAELGTHLKEDLIPNSVEYYLNMMNDFDVEGDEDDFIDEDEDF